MLRDLRHAVRVLLKARTWTCVVLLSLALGTGASTALFSAVNGLLIRTIPVGDPDALVRLGWTGENDMVRNVQEYGYRGGTATGERVAATFSHPMFEALRDAGDSLEGMLATAPVSPVRLVIDGRAEAGSAFVVTGNYFDLLGVPALIGRVLTPGDDRAGAPPVGVIGHGLWTRLFGASPAALGRVISVNDTAVTIVGVLPPDHTGVLRPVDEAADVVLPLSLHPTLSGESRLTDPMFWWLNVMGRTRPGVTPAQVQGDLEGVFRAAARSGIDSYVAGLPPAERSLASGRDRGAIPTLMADSGSRGVYDADPRSSRQATILGFVVAGVLLIVCANVATLLLARAAARQREMAVRLSVGGTRGRMLRQLVTESLLLSALGGALGMVVALGARRLLPFGQTAPFDWRVLAFALALSLATGLLFGLVPALRTTRLDLAGVLNAHGRTVARSGSRLGRSTVVAQVALALVLLVGAGLFLKTLGNLRAVPVGFNPANLLLFQVDPSVGGREPGEVMATYDRLTERLRALPGVVSVALSRIALLGGGAWTGSAHVQGRTGPEGFTSHTMLVSPTFFETMEIAVLTGRTFGLQDGREAPAVAVLNAAAARELFGDEQPLGRRLGFSPEAPDEFEVIGVVQDAKYRGIRESAPPTIYRSTRQAPLGRGTFVVRTAGPPGAMTAAVRGAVREVDATLPILDVSTQAAEIEERLSDERLFALAYTLFGGLATLLAAIGLFGHASYSVAQRTNEIGIRMALGADAGSVARTTLGQSLALVVVGLGIGMAAVALGGRVVASLLFDVAPTDPLTIAQAVVTLLSVAAVAGYLPARRAARVDPTIALQHE
jgi:predicted permease